VAAVAFAPDAAPLSHAERFRPGTVGRVGGLRFVDEIGLAFGWIAPKPRFMQRASHAVASDGRVWVIDPVADERALDRARELGDPAGVVQLLDRHGRDCRAVAEQLGVPHYEVPGQPPAGAPFEVLPLLRSRWWHEVAVWYPEQRTLVCADAVGTAQYYRAPGERLGVSPLLRLTPPRRLLALEPEHVLVGHGEGIHQEAAAALLEAITLARRRILGRGRPPRARPPPSALPLARRHGDVAQTSVAPPAAAHSVRKRSPKLNR
jgi:hypothetical protein